MRQPLPLSFEVQGSCWRPQNCSPVDPKLGRMVSRPSAVQSLGEQSTAFRAALVDQVNRAGPCPCLEVFSEAPRLSPSHVAFESTLSVRFGRLHVPADNETAFFPSASYVPGTHFRSVSAGVWGVDARPRQTA